MNDKLSTFLARKSRTEFATTKPSLPLSQHLRLVPRGIALISVLAMVMLLTALVVAFMLRAGSEKQSSGFYRAEATTRDLSDTTLNLVEGLINEGTTQTSTTAGTFYSWASQPGAIRVFDNVNGAPYKIFKLYSAPSMVKSVASTTDVQSFLTADAPPGTWYSAPGSWVDLNAPVNVDTNPQPFTTSGGAKVYLGQPTYTHFPILDPRPSQNLLTTLDKVNPSTKAPYMDGFSITGAPTDTSGSAASAIDVNNSTNTPEVSPVPMPVRWLYVLQDGTMTAPTSGPDASGNYTFSNLVPTATNPIVGRIAFWTDDETCKVNINTAGADGIMNDKNGTPKNMTPDNRADPSAIAEGTFWTVPRFAATDDAAETVDFGAPGSGPWLPGCCSAQPVMGEYQRYPGHPATVALSNILNGLGVTINTTTFYNQSTLFNAATPTVASTITGAGITPRYVYGGSQENTVDTFNGNPYGLPGYNAGVGINASAIPTSYYRLYPTLSELLFNPTRTATVLNTTDATTRQRMESARFFLTAHSRAPELNLFGLPRVNMWPLSNTASNFSAVDQLLAFCTTIGGKGSGDTYYFTRKTVGGSYDSTVDIGIPRNVVLLNYLDYLTKQNVPGFSSGAVGTVSFATKNYGGGLIGQNDQILSEIFDYIRTTNLQDPNSPSPYNLSPAYNGGGYSAGPPGWQGGAGQNQVVPDLATPTVMGGSWSGGNTTQGYGSFPRLVEVTIQFVAMGTGGTSPTSLAIPVSPAEVAYPGNLLGSGDSGPTTLYNHPPSGPATASQPYAPPGTPGGAPSGTSNMVSPVFNFITGPINPTTLLPTGLNSGIPPDGTTAVQAFLYVTFVNPAQGWTYTGPYVWFTMAGQSAITFGSSGGTQYNAGFSDPEAMVFQSDQNIGGGRSGYYPIFGNYQYYNLNGSSSPNPYSFPFFSKIIPLANSSTMSFTGGNLRINLYDAPNGNGSLPSVTTLAGDTVAPTGGHLIQTYTVPFFNTTETVPMPFLPGNSNGYPSGVTPATPYSPYSMINNPTPCYITPNVAYGTVIPTGQPNAGAYTVTAFEETGPIIGVGEPAGAVPIYDRWRNYYVSWNQGPVLIGPGDTMQSMVLSKTWSDPRLLAISNVPATAWVQHPSVGQQFAHNLFTSGPLYPLTGNAGTGTLAGNLDSMAYWGGTWPWAPSIFGSVPPTTISGAPPDWDNGVSFASDGPWINKADEGSNPYNGLPYYGNPVVQQTAFFSPNRQVYSPGMLGSLPTGVDPAGTKPAGWQTLLFRPGPAAAGYPSMKHPGEGTPVGSTYAPPYTTIPDHLWMDLFWMPVAEPYPISEPMSTAGKINMNYQILPFTYIKRATALRAAMATEKIAEVGLDQPQEKGPGGYLNGLYVDGVINQSTTIANLIPARFPMDLDLTMTQFDAKFDLTNTTTGCDIFRSASQICETFLVPMDIPNTLPHGTSAPHSTGTYEELISPGGNYSPISTAGVANFALDWYTPVTSPTTPAPYALVGDNVREEPYGRLYGKLTTKSNTFTVYYRVQSLKKPASVAANQWNENTGTITGEYRGSTTLERFIDPNEGTTSGGTFTPTIPDAASQAASGSTPTSLESYYKWRVVENHQFAP